MATLSANGANTFLFPSRLVALQNRKRELDLEITKEMKRPAPCQLTLQALKRKRLFLSDKIVRAHKRAVLSIAAI